MKFISYYLVHSSFHAKSLQLLVSISQSPTSYACTIQTIIKYTLLEYDHCGPMPIHLTTEIASK